MNSLNNICTTCTGENIKPRAGSGVGSYEEDQIEYWKIINFFYPDYNPFNQFSPKDITSPVVTVINQMSATFRDCCYKTAPLEYVAILASITSGIASSNPYLMLEAMALMVSGTVPGGIGYQACRNTTAASSRSRLHMAFLGI